MCQLLNKISDLHWKKSSSNFTELFHESRIQAIREQSVARFSKLLADNAERFRNNSKKFCNFLSESRRKVFNNYYRSN